MRFWLRWTANGLTVFLALYLVDSVADGRFRISAVWVAAVLAVLLGLLNSVVRPLRRARSRPLVAFVRAVIILLVNVLVLQVFVWLGASLAVESFVWTLAVAVLVSVLTGTVSWLVGFSSKEKQRQRPVTRPQADGSSPRDGGAKTSQTRT